MRVLAPIALVLAACSAPAAPDAGPVVIGAPCSADADCGGAGGHCVLTNFYWGAFPGGYCSVSCGAFGPTGCGEGGICGALPMTGPSCFDGCTSSSECRAGYACQVHFAAEGEMACLPIGDAG